MILAELRNYLQQHRRAMLIEMVNRFDVEPETIEKIRTDDEALLDFGLRWLRFSLFGESTLKIKDEELEKKKEELGISFTEEGEV